MCKLVFWRVGRGMRSGGSMEQRSLLNNVYFRETVWTWDLGIIERHKYVFVKK
jgi:hypothetical protein